MITIGVCALDTKARSKPMRNILNRIIQNSPNDFTCVIFGDKVILDESIETWPTCDVLISFFSTGFPLDKAIEYVELRKPYCVNSLPLQHLLHDRRVVLMILDAVGVPTPRRLVSQKSIEDIPNFSPKIIQEVKTKLNIDLSPSVFSKLSQVRMINEDILEIDGERLSKPFVEKPIFGENHNINIYYPSGGVRKLFRKVGNKSSEYVPDLSEIRDDGSYIYEEFMNVDNAEDVKVYTLGSNYFHAETRKSPVVDGVVRRNSEGKEVRYVCSLTKEEKEIAKKVTRAFGQQICGFDLLRAKGKSYVIDVNGWSFVKGSDDYYNNAARILRNISIDAVSKSRFAPNSPINSSKVESAWKLKSFLSVLRHGDRTPKQKLKFSGFKSQPFIELLNGGKDEVVLKKPEQLALFNSAIEKAIALKLDDAKNISQLSSLMSKLSTCASLKIQIKPSYKKDNNGVNSLSKMQVVVKWGGEFTHSGASQSKDLGENLRKDLRLINKDLLSEVKVYSSSETRVIQTADVFTKAFLDVEVLPDDFFIVNKEMLDDSLAAKEQMEIVKRKLQYLLSPPPQDTIESPAKPHSIAESNGVMNSSLSSITSAEFENKREVSNIIDLRPSNLVEELVVVLNSMREAMIKNFDEMDVDSIQPFWCCNESPFLFRERWEKVFRDFCDVKRISLEPSKISELYDSIKFDLLHNRVFAEKIFSSDLNDDPLRKIYTNAKIMFDFIGPQEYGIEEKEKSEIAKLSAYSLLKQLVSDLEESRDSSGPSTRIYFTKESKIICLLNIVMLCGLPTKGVGEFPAATLFSNFGNTDYDELDYLTQITFELYERTSAEVSEYSLRIGFSPGASSSNLIDLQLDHTHSLHVAPRRWISDHISLEDALKYLDPKI